MHPETKARTTGPDRPLRPGDDRCSIFENCEPHEEQRLQSDYRDLRTRRIAEYGWIDLADGDRDRDFYDDIGANTLTVVLHSAGELLACGARLTLVTGQSIAESLSASMWPDAASRRIAANRHLAAYFESGDLVDCTRLLLNDHAGPAQALELIGACVAATDGLMGTYMTVQRVFVDFFASCGIPVDLIHEDLLDGVPSAFIMIRPPKELTIDDLRTRQCLSRGALLVDALAAPGFPFFSAPAIDIRDNSSLKEPDHRPAPTTMAKLKNR